MSVYVFSAASSELSGEDLGTVVLPQPVFADGTRLPPGTYRVRLTDDGLSSGPGESPRRHRWVEFVRAGTVAGGAAAVVVPSDAIEAIAKGPRPAVNGSRVELLRGGDYARIWINCGDEHLIIHLPITR